ncbi:unnamed protein product [Lactuca virosa]|uniref:Isopenicillin N synthase-like Fe(2+) 2OG dioxygenase domain-containing protein n=1 Tax=Lactuca virosa TaxID=75947 RepID=A0AAU9N1C1_9ASTR|nr:unnamed protein product [Lactuca virosa]
MVMWMILWVLAKTLVCVRRRRCKALLNLLQVTICRPSIRPFEGIYGAGAHSDYGFITPLATDNVSGLPIRSTDTHVNQCWPYES